jgi:hypothetical protein
MSLPLGVTSPAKRSSMIANTLCEFTAHQINDGLDLLHEMSDLVDDAYSVLTDVKEYKLAVDSEMETLYQPLEILFSKAVVAYDPRTGNIAFKHGVDGQASLHKLRQMLSSLFRFEFKCFDLKVLHEDCVTFLSLMDEHVPYDDAQAALDLIHTAVQNKVNNPIFANQIHEFHQWAAIQLSADTLRTYLVNGNVPHTAQHGIEVSFQDIVKLIDTLKSLSEPSELVQTVVRVGEWVVKVRQYSLYASTYRETGSYLPVLRACRCDHVCTR